MGTRVKKDRRIKAFIEKYQIGATCFVNSEGKDFLGNSTFSCVSDAIDHIKVMEEKRKAEFPFRSNRVRDRYLALKWRIEVTGL